MKVALACCGAVMFLVAQLTVLLGADDRGAEVRALRAGSGIETTGEAVATFERQRVERSRWGKRTVSETCGEFAYRVSGERYTHRDYEQCGDVEVGDELALIYDPAQPTRAFNNSDAWLESLDDQATSVWWYRAGGFLLMVPLLVSVIGRVRRAVAT